ncbi:hypothetical protein LTR13_007834 [Exophiala sideris]|nr:hypothetical protein LTR13_007834 [Exophiala sideris]
MNDPAATQHLRRDILQQMFEIHDQKGTKVDFTPKAMMQECYMALFAGSDTTAIAMRAMFYYLMTNPAVYAELMAELDESLATGIIPTSGPISYAQAIKLPYVCATIKEAMRLHPSVGLTMPRHVPAGGLRIGDQVIPAGYRVGVNAAVVQYDQSVFGPDSYSFRPRRWLEGDTTHMDRCMIQFGAGTRTCIGKNVGFPFSTDSSKMHQC